MGNKIDRFIWGYQTHFRVGANVSAESLYQRLDDRFEPQVFLVALRVEDRTDRWPACVEPEDRFWIASEAFEGALEQAASLASNDPESKVLHSSPVAHQWHEERLFKKGVRSAVLEVIEACSTRPVGMCYSCSWPVPRDGFLVMVVLGLQVRVIDSHPVLSISRIDLEDDYRSVEVPVSLIDAATEEFLGDIINELFKPNAGAGLSFSKSPDEILRAAGQRMMAGVGRRIDSWDHNLGAEPGLFDACNRIAATKYERQAARGGLILARQSHPAITTELVFEEPVSLHSSRAARKSLQIAASDAKLHLNARDIWGLAKLGDYQSGAEDLFEVRIVDHHTWELLHAGIVFMRVRESLPSLPKPALDSAHLRGELNRVFGCASSPHVDPIVSLAEAAACEPHGTMLVISSQAASEAERLKSQCVKIKPRQLTPNLLKQLTTIDGALLLDQQGVCHAIGVILDGLATSSSGSSARGARFNSAVRYVNTRQEPTIAIVVSEDGGVDIVSRAAAE